MSDVTLEQVIQLADQLNSEDREALKRHLDSRQLSPQHEPVTFETLRAELARRVASGAFTNAHSLANYWAEPDFDLTDEELRAGIKEFSNEWERDLDELGDD